MTKPTLPFSHFVDIVKALRDPIGGCPWDLEQTHQTLRPYLIEEAYEVLEAIENGDQTELCSELGDLLLQVVLHAQLADEHGKFSINDVISGITEKMIRRHPHVFGDVKVENSQEVLHNWEAIKQTERQGNVGSSTSFVTGVPVSLPALLRAQRLGEKAAKAKFDWKSVVGVWKKVEEEMTELQGELNPFLSLEKDAPERGSSAYPPAFFTQEQRACLEHELGDVLFSLCQLSRFLGLSAEGSLRACCERFIARFQEMERAADGPLQDLSEDELEKLWDNAKRKLESNVNMGSGQETKG